MTSGKTINRSITNNTKLQSKKTKRISLPFHLKCLNLRAKSGNSAIKKHDSIIDKPLSNHGEENKVNIIGPLLWDAISAREQINIPLAGVGRPMNDSD